MPGRRHPRPLRCRPGYSSRHCEQGGGSTICRPGLCLHGGTCQLTSSGTAVCSCLSGWVGDRCERPQSCRHYCFNGARCTLARDEDGPGREAPVCHCPAGFIGLRCASRVPGSLGSGKSSHNSLVTGALVAVTIVAVLLAVVAWGVWRKRNGKPFGHTRMRPDKLEVDNPMYLRDLEARDDAAEGEDVEDAVFSLEEKPTNFSNPGYDSTYPERDGAATSSEKTNLLPPENGRPSLTFAGAAPSDPLREADT